MKLNILGRHQRNVLVKTVVYDFSNLNSAEAAHEFEKQISSITNELDVGIVVNNVGRCWFGKFHDQSYDMMFNMMSVNIAS